MDKYEKGANIEQELCFAALPFSSHLEESKVVMMNVKAGSKCGNLVRFARKMLDSKEKSCIVFSGHGAAVSKVVGCAEMLKQSHRKLHQYNAGDLHVVEELWEPKMEGLDRLRVVREQPRLHILLSVDPCSELEEQGKMSVFLGVKEQKKGRDSRSNLRNASAQAAEQLGIHGGRKKSRPQQGQKSQQGPKKTKKDTSQADSK